MGCRAGQRGMPHHLEKGVGQLPENQPSLDLLTFLVQPSYPPPPMSIPPPCPSPPPQGGNRHLAHEQ